MPRRRARRAHTILFWALVVLFLAVLCYLGLLAFTRNIDLTGSAVERPRLAESLPSSVPSKVAAGIARLLHH